LRLQEICRKKYVEYLKVTGFLTKYNLKISIRVILYDSKLHFDILREQYIAIKKYTTSQNNVKKNNQTGINTYLISYFFFKRIY